MLASHSAADLLDENGNSSIEAVRRRGLGYLLREYKVKEVTHPNGNVERTLEFKIENRKGFLELMGKHFGLWDSEIKDPLQVLADMLNVPKHLLPTSLGDEPLTIPNELLEDDKLS